MLGLLALAEESSILDGPAVAVLPQGITQGNCWGECPDRIKLVSKAFKSSVFYQNNIRGVDGFGNKSTELMIDLSSEQSVCALFLVNYMGHVPSQQGYLGHGQILLGNDSNQFSTSNNLIKEGFTDTAFLNMDKDVSGQCY